MPSTTAYHRSPSGMPLHRTLLLAIALLLQSTVAHAEAALAELILMMPAILIKGLYVELARPWVIAGLWTAAFVCWLLARSAGRDVVGGWLERSSDRDGGRFSMTSYGLLAFFASAALLLLLLGMVLWGPPQDVKKKPGQQFRVAPTPGKAAPRLKHTLPYPYGKSPHNSAGTWPTSSGSLPGQPYLAYGGPNHFMLRNPGDEALWVRVCAADANPCVPLRQVFLRPRDSYRVERLNGGDYRLEYTQTTGRNLSGTREGVAVADQASHWTNTYELREFKAKP